jgi:predicted ATPase/class 3 adenylate cyclase
MHSQEAELPTGTVTFLLTDVAGSTRLWESEADVSMRSAIVRHYQILSEVVAAHGGARPQEQGEGDSIVAAFTRPSDALAAAVAAQQALAAEPWPTTEPLRVRMAIHTGEAHLRDDCNYAGQAIIRAARLRAVGHGGQVLVSGATRDLAVDQTGATFGLRSLGQHRLRDLDRPEHVWQLLVPDTPSEFEPLVTLDTVPNSLPISLSPFIGREAEMAELAALMRVERLVTVTGTGGAGKTRLAQQIGAELIDEFPGGVWWVELAAFGNVGVESAVRAAFGISGDGQTSLPEAVRRMLVDQRCLLIVDNCEHVTGSVAPLINELLGGAPTLSVLATSRVMLDLPGEHAWRVPSLGLPDRGGTASVNELGYTDSVRLFCDRARRSRTSFELTEANGPVVAKICHRLGGIPLAIELAAARTRTLDPQRILDGLDDAFRILSGGSKVLMPRQQTLEASIAWSHDLLTPVERTLLRRLSVFVDGWTLDTAEAVCPDGSETGSTSARLDAPQVFEALDRLVDHSLVHTSETPLGLRFGMLETIRQYAQHQLAIDPVEQLSVRSRHAVNFTDWAVSIEDALLAGGTGALIDTIEAERSNLFAATDHAIGSDPDRAIEALWSVVGPAIGSFSAAVPTVLSQLDQLEGRVSMNNEWKLLAVRSRMAILGDVAVFLAASERWIECAGATDQPLGLAIARTSRLAILASLGAPILDDLDHAFATLDQIDQRWARFYRVACSAYGALHEHIGWAQATLDAAGPDLRGPLVDDSSRLTCGLIALARSEDMVAVDHLQPLLEFRRPSYQSFSLGFPMLALAAAGLGLDLTQEIERRLRYSCNVEGHPFRGILADSVLIIRHLLADDLVEAHRCLARAIETGVSLNYKFRSPAGEYMLVAAGQPDLRRNSGDYSIRAPEDHLTEAIHRLKAKEIDRALEAAHRALSAAQASGVRRVTLLGLECVAQILAQANRYDEATRLGAACSAFRESRSLVRYPCMQRLYDESLAACRGALGVGPFEEALAEGATLDLEAAAERHRSDEAESHRPEDAVKTGVGATPAAPVSASDSPRPPA